MIASDAATIRALASSGEATGSRVIATLRGVGPRATQLSLARLRDAGLVEQLGEGAGTRWRLACTEEAALLALRVELARRMEARLG